MAMLIVAFQSYQIEDLNFQNRSQVFKINLTVTIKCSTFNKFIQLYGIYLDFFFKRIEYIFSFIFFSLPRL